jgi:hypothetical protein
LGNGGEHFRRDLQLHLAHGDRRGLRIVRSPCRRLRSHRANLYILELRSRSVGNIGQIFSMNLSNLESGFIAGADVVIAEQVGSEGSFYVRYLSVSSSASNVAEGQTQFSTLIPGMRLNSRILLVTTINPSLRA